jgi:hypothetical protein
MLAIFCFLICLVHCTHAASFEELDKNVLSQIAQAMPWESRIRFGATCKDVKDCVENLIAQPIDDYFKLFTIEEQKSFVRISGSIMLHPIVSPGLRKDLVVRPSSKTRELEDLDWIIHRLGKYRDDIILNVKSHSQKSNSGYKYPYYYAFSCTLTSGGAGAYADTEKYSDQEIISCMNKVYDTIMDTCINKNKSKTCSVYSYVCGMRYKHYFM